MEPKGAFFAPDVFIYWYLLQTCHALKSDAHEKSPWTVRSRQRSVETAGWSGSDRPVDGYDGREMVMMGVCECIYIEYCKTTHKK